MANGKFEGAVLLILLMVKLQIYCFVFLQANWFWTKYVFLQNQKLTSFLFFLN